ncbi:MAG: DUF362 domain-containing protein [Deltaproteobacteria bacterium]|nr:DUF362 domain-containing protein [Deltaproteobacteria bacterium]
MSKVALVRCDSYELERVREAIEQALDPLGGMGAFVKPGQRVLIKVNMLRPSPPEAAVTTHPSVAVALALMVRDLGAHPAIGDSCGGAKAYGLSEQALVETGIKPLADEHGIETILFETAGMQWMERPQNKFLKIFPVSKAVLGADVIINAPKLKTHVETLLTGAVKNMFGALPGASKLRLHRAAPGPVALGQALLDIYSTLTPG